MSIGDFFEDCFEEVGNAVTGAANTVAEEVTGTATSFGESVANYAIIVGDSLAGAGTTIGNGVVTFGNSFEQFSVSASGTAFNWLKTSAYDVENWVEEGAGIIANFTVDAFEEARDGLIVAWNFLKNLFTGHLHRLDAPSETARQIAYFILSVTALGYEEMAKNAGMTIGFVIKLSGRVLFGISGDLGLYVDDDGRWGFMELGRWEDFKNLSSASISLDSGISLSIENTFVFGSRNTYSGKGFFKLGAEAKFGAFSAGGAVLIDADDFDFLGFSLSASIGLDLAPNTADHTKPPGTTFSLTGQSVNVAALVGSVGSAGSVYDAAVTAVRDPGKFDQVVSTALAATMQPFAPRFYGSLSCLQYPGQRLLIGAYNALWVGDAYALPGSTYTFRFVAGLADPKAVSIQVMMPDGRPSYVRVDEGLRVLVDARLSEDSTFDAQATFNMEQGLADKKGVSICTRTPQKQYLRIIRTGTQLSGGLLQPAQSDGSDSFARQATFLLDPQPMPPSETAVLRAGDTLRVGEYRRSPDGRYFMTLRSDGAVHLGRGTSPSFARPPQLAGAPGTGWVLGAIRTDGSFFVTVPTSAPPCLCSGTPSSPLIEKTLEISGQPGAMFMAVSDAGRIVTVQGTPESPRELLHTSHTGTVYWSTSRKSVALQTSDGRFVRWAPSLGSGVEFGNLFADSNKLSSYESFQLLEHFDGTFSLRSAGGYHLNNQQSVMVFVDQEHPNGQTSFRTPAYGNGQVYLRSASSNMLLSAEPNGSMAFVSGDWQGVPKTLFTIIPLERNLAAEVGRAFRIVSKLSGRCLTVRDGSQVENTGVIQLSATGGRNQSFTLIAKSPGVYSFAAQHSGQALDLAGTTANTPLLQRTASSAASQQFRLLPNTDGTYRIVSNLNSLVLEVNGDSLYDGAAIVLATANPTNIKESQRFLIEPEETLVTRALIADPLGGQPTMRVRYQERAGQSAWLDGWLDAIDSRLAGDFLGLGHAQLLCINRSGQGGRVMLADFSRTNDAGTGRALYYEPFGETAWLNGWTDDNDWHLAGDFKRLGRSQLLIINRGGSGGRLAILELTTQGYRAHYWQNWGDSALFNGWQDDVDRWLVGDFMGRGYDQVLCLNRNGAGGKLMIVDFSGSTPTIPYWENWGQNPWLDARFLTNSMRHYVGDFLGLGYAQLLVIDPISRATKICDFKSGAPVIRVDTIGPGFGGWLDDEDVQVVGDFMGLSRAQLLCANRRPWSNGKVALFDFATQPFPTPYVEPWSQRTCFDGLLEPLDLVFAADFMGDGRKQAQVLVCSPNIKSAPHPTLIPQSGASASSEGLSIRVRFSGKGDRSVPMGAAAYEGGANVEGFTLELSPPIEGLGIEYMASVIGQGNTAWTAGGSYCGSSVAGRAIERIAVRLTGPNKDRYTIGYSGNGALASDGEYVGTVGQNKPLTSLRIGSLRLRPASP